LDNNQFKAAVISILYKASEGARAMERALEKIFREADKAISKGANIIVLSDGNE
jgi:glutamate synthase (ferredoxin)